jgi:hypothetical protein
MKRFALLLAIVLAGDCFSAFGYPEWRYKMPVYLEATTSAQTNINRRIEVHWTYRMATDFSDVRFYNKTGDTLYYAWMETTTKVDGDSSNWWIKIPYKPSSADTAYLVYGNQYTSNYSNGDSTFVRFDYDYDAAPILCDDWTSYLPFGYGDRSIGYGISMSWRKSFAQNTPYEFMFDFGFLGSDALTFVGISDEEGYQWETKFTAGNDTTLLGSFASAIPQVGVVPSDGIIEPCENFGWVEAFLDTVTRPWHTYRVEIWDSVTTKAYTDNVLESSISNSMGGYIAAEESLRVWIFASAHYPFGPELPNGGCDTLCPLPTLNFRDVFVYRLKNDIVSPELGDPSLTGKSDTCRRAKVCE